MMIRVLIVSDTYLAYGAEKIMLWLGRELSRDADFLVEFAAMFDKEKSEYIGNNISYLFGIDSNKPKYFRLFDYFVSGYLSLRQLFRNCKYDYVVSFGQHSYYILLSLRRIFGFKLVLSERNDPYAVKPFIAFLRKQFYKHADRIVFQTIGAKAFYTNCDREKTNIIPNPIEIPEAKWDIKKTTPSIINVGRLDIKQKRQDVLIKAFRQVVEKYPEAILELCGDGQDRVQLEDLSEKLGIRDRVIFHGKVTNVQDYLLKARVFVFTSDYEGIPNALMEAMALGMPVISTKCSPGGAELLIDSGINGFLVERGDVCGLVDKIIKIISDYNQAVNIGNKARISMAAYNTEEIIEKWKKCFK